MPGRLIFSTTAPGAATPVERMRIDSSGAVTLGTTPSFSSPGDKTVATTGYVSQAIGAPVVEYGNQVSNTRTIASTDVAKYIRYTGANPVTFVIPSTLTGTLNGSLITFRRTTNAGVITLSAGSGVVINDNNSAAVAVGKTFSIKLINSANKIWDFID
jgi:hypothetical protein